jgi:hypothetical protein
MLRGQFPSRPATLFRYTLCVRGYVGVAFGFAMYHKCG